MKIVSVGNFGHGWDGSICDEEHIAGALEELGHTVYRMQRDEMNRYASADFTLIAQWDGYTQELIDTLPRPLVYWAYDHQDENQRWHRRLVYASDLYLSKRLADQFLFPDKKWQWLAQDFAPKFLDKHPLRVEKDIDVLFTGTYLDFANERNAILKAVDEKFNLVIHSVNPEAWKERGFKNVNGPIMDDGLPELYARAKVILSIDHTIEAGYWSDRLSQILCCGGFALHKYVPLCENTFHDNIGYFYNTVDCLDKVQYYLDNYDEREDISRRGYEYAQKNLKVINRVKDMLIITESIL